MRMLLLLVAAILLWKVLHHTFTRPRFQVVCRNCGTCDFPRTISPRNRWVEIILWISYLIPGVIYTLWCTHQTYDVCDKCGSRDIVPLDSPVGRKLMGQAPIDVTPPGEKPRK